VLVWISLVINVHSVLQLNEHFILKVFHSCIFKLSAAICAHYCSEVLLCACNKKAVVFSRIAHVGDGRRVETTPVRTFL
jgi:hypothetical protein